MAVDSFPAPIRDIGLCLSGGGYRAAAYHLGALLRLNQAGLLPRLRTVSSVSGGSIVAAFLGLNWTGQTTLAVVLLVLAGCALLVGIGLLLRSRRP